MKLHHLVSFTHVCYLTVDYCVYHRLFMTMYLKILVRTELRYFITVAVWPVSFKINF